MLPILNSAWACNSETVFTPEHRRVPLLPIEEINNRPGCAGFLIFAVLQLSLAQTHEDENVILGRPGDDSIGIHIRAPEGTEVFAEYG